MTQISITSRGSGWMYPAWRLSAKLWHMWLCEACNKSFPPLSQNHLVWWIEACTRTHITTLGPKMTGPLFHYPSAVSNDTCEHPKSILYQLCDVRTPLMPRWDIDRSWAHLYNYWEFCCHRAQVLWTLGCVTPPSPPISNCLHPEHCPIKGQWLNFLQSHVTPSVFDFCLLEISHGVNIGPFDQPCLELDLFIFFIWWWPPKSGAYIWQGHALMWAWIAAGHWEEKSRAQ